MNKVKVAQELVKLAKSLTAAADPIQELIDAAEQANKFVIKVAADHDNDAMGKMALRTSERLQSAIKSAKSSR